ncbi:ABC transporter substrate-binding protein [Paenibacillus rigui]|uniref:ABC transporter substrate-binding protein n=1 Tax=Paenibacillus rigui TaxID=554312 RepID=A0A229ULN9_9BACL|nr:extracellular solute-binding protein [Paenibacillus rigui]OXM84368.1 ABC transporter substrate-binding protein [Paenibacillus rigui]
MNSKKAWISIVSMTLVAGTIAGCSTGSGTDTKQAAAPSAANTPAAEKKQPVTLTFWGGVPEENGPKAVVDAWNKQNPDIQVKYERFVNDDAGNLKLDTALIAGQNVDLFVNYSTTRLQKRVDNGNVVDMSAWKDYNIDEKMGPEAAEWKLDGKYYGLPTKKNIYFFWLNKDALDKAGLPVPTEWTWKDVQDYAVKLKTDKRYGLVQHMEAFPDPMDGSLAAKKYVKADGTSDFNNPLVGTWLETLNAMMQDGKATPPLGEQLTTKMPVETVFLKGEAAMMNAGEWIFRSANDLKANPRDFKIAFAPVPKVTKEQADYKIRGGLGDTISISAKSANKEAAWKFLKWYADGGMMPMASGGRIPSSKDASAEEATKLLLGDAAGTYDQDSLKKVVFGKFTTYNRDLPQQVMDLRREEYEKYFLGKQDLKTTLDALAKRHNDFLKQSKK